MKRRKVGTLLAGLMLVSAMALPVSATNSGGDTNVYTEVPEEWTLTIPLDTEIPYNQTKAKTIGDVYVAGNINADTIIQVSATRTELYQENLSKLEDVTDRNKINYTLDSALLINTTVIGNIGFGSAWKEIDKEKTKEFTVFDMKAVSDDNFFNGSPQKSDFTKLGSYNSLMCHLNTFANMNEGRPLAGSVLKATVPENEWENAEAGEYVSTIVFQATARSDSSEDEGGSGNLPH